MRFPHFLNKNVVLAYLPHDQSLNLVFEQGRQLRSEDYEWDVYLVPSLVQLCVKALADWYEQRQTLEFLPCADRENVLEILHLEMPLHFVVPLMEVRNDKHDDSSGKQKCNKRK